jgi:hypothetical protein
VHILAAGNAGNLSACGQSGRFAVGDSAMFDFRSGDLWQYKYLLSPRLKPSNRPSPTFEGDARGSPDGTKVHFTAAYDLEQGPVTEVAEPFRATEDMLRVKSTSGFPESGQIVFWSEVIGYQRKTVNSFQGLTRGMHGTLVSTMIPQGRAITELRHHLLPDEEWAGSGAAAYSVRLGVADLASPLARQRQSGLYVAVVRRPDPPVLRMERERVQLIPGESHEETCGYHLLCDGKRITQKPLRPDAGGSVNKPGIYQAVAVEWSGLESAAGPMLIVKEPTEIRVLAAPPEESSWTQPRWLVNGNEATHQEASLAAAAECEIIHRIDGPIAREWYERGKLVRRHDLNAEGKAIRRLAYADGKLETRDYFDRMGQHVSREVFAPDGFITELILFHRGPRGTAETDHWWYERGTPVRRMIGGWLWSKQGENWTQESPRR